MEEVTSLLFNYGIGFVIVGLFIYDWITNKKDIKKTLGQNEKALEEIANSTKNTAKSLELLQQSMSEQKSMVERIKYSIDEMRK